MRRRKLFWLLAGLVLATMAAGVFVVGLRPHGVTAANFARIRVNMTRQEVESILRSPPDSDQLGPPYWMGRDSDWDPPPVDGFTLEWVNGRRKSTVYFDNRGRVDQSRFLRTDSLVDSVLEWLEDRWQEWFP
jgi:hypothetical protein